jgi:hypothetical protein
MKELGILQLSSQEVSQVCVPRSCINSVADGDLVSRQMMKPVISAKTADLEDWQYRTVVYIP